MLFFVWLSKIKFVSTTFFIEAQNNSSIQEHGCIVTTFWRFPPSILSLYFFLHYSRAKRDYSLIKLTTGNFCSSNVGNVAANAYNQWWSFNWAQLPPARAGGLLLARHSVSSWISILRFILSLLLVKIEIERLSRAVSILTLILPPSRFCNNSLYNHSCSLVDLISHNNVLLPDLRRDFLSRKLEKIIIEDYSIYHRLPFNSSGKSWHYMHKFIFAW